MMDGITRELKAKDILLGGPEVHARGREEPTAARGTEPTARGIEEPTKQILRKSSPPSRFHYDYDDIHMADSETHELREERTIKRGLLKAIGKGKGKAQQIVDKDEEMDSENDIDSEREEDEDDDDLEAAAVRKMVNNDIGDVEENEEDDDDLEAAVRPLLHLIQTAIEPLKESFKARRKRRPQTKGTTLTDTA